MAIGQEKPIIGNQLYNKTFGIIGYGRLGKISSIKTKALRLIVNDMKKIKSKNVKMVYSQEHYLKNRFYFSSCSFK